MSKRNYTVRTVGGEKVCLPFISETKTKITLQHWNGNRLEFSKKLREERGGKRRRSAWILTGSGRRERVSLELLHEVFA